MAKLTLIKRTEPFCGACQMLQNQLDSGELDYNVIDITEDESAISRYDLTSVPVLHIRKDNGELEELIGFHPVEEVIEIMEG